LPLVADGMDARRIEFVGCDDDPAEDCIAVLARGLGLGPMLEDGMLKLVPHPPTVTLTTTVWRLPRERAARLALVAPLLPSQDSKGQTSRSLSTEDVARLRGDLAALEANDEAEIVSRPIVVVHLDESAEIETGLLTSETTDDAWLLKVGFLPTLRQGALTVELTSTWSVSTTKIKLLETSCAPPGLFQFDTLDGQMLLFLVEGTLEGQ
jgi:hypothetical protein